MLTALKQLTASDLSFFRVHLQRSKQKGINLNQDVFIEEFYPGLRRVFSEYTFPLVILGPGGRAAHRLSRKVTRSQNSKNWRLNGEFVFDPDDEAGRYNSLEPGDFAVFGFAGDERPDFVMLALIGTAEDPELHSLVARTFRFAGKRTMISALPAQMMDLFAATADRYEEHPLASFVGFDTVEDALYGEDAPSAAAVRRNGRSTPLTPQELLRQLRAAEETGELGEQLFQEWLARSGHEEDDWEWTSRRYARAPYDFHVHRPSWTPEKTALFVDVKTTRGASEQPLHLSIAELRWAARNENFRIARVFAVASERPRMYVLGGIAPVAREVLGRLDALQTGVGVDSLKFDPTLFVVEHEADLGFD